MENKIWENIQKIKDQSPLVHNITNYVVMNNSANALLACGASPIMAHAKEEIEQMVSICSATILNIGTLDNNSVESMILAMQYSKKYGKPTILYPVGVGATTYRKESAEKIIKAGIPTIIRANASEIIALSGIKSTSKGVDSTATSDESYAPALELARKLGCTVSVSGEIDIVVSGNNVAYIYNGDKMMEKVTGMGCSLSAIHGAMIAVCKDEFLATISAVALLGVCGEIAAKNSVGSGSLQINILDKLYNLTKEEFIKTLKIEIKKI